MTLKIALLAPMPMASVSSVMKVNIGVRASRRPTRRTCVIKECIRLNTSQALEGSRNVGRNLGAGSRLDLAAVFLALRDHCAVYQELTVVGGLDHGTGDTYVWIPAVEHTSREAALVTGFKGHTNLAVGGALAQPK